MEVMFFDIAAIVIISFLIVALYLRKMTYGRNNKLFICLLFCVLISAVTDFVSLYVSKCINLDSRTIIISALADYLYFIFRNLTPLMYLLYIVSVTDTWHILKSKKWLKVVFFVPTLISILLIVTNPFSHQLFYYDTRFVYHRGVLINILYYISGIYALYGIVYLLVFRKTLSADRLFVLSSIYPFNLFALIVQYFYPQYLIEMFMTSLTLLLAVLVLQRPEEMMNPDLLVGNYIGFERDTLRAFELKKHLKIVFVKIVNYKSLSSFLEYNTLKNLLKSFADGLKQIKSNDLSIYYLDNGLFSLICDEDELVIASRVSELVKEKFYIKQYELSLNSCICVVRCPEDIDNVQVLWNFANYYHTYLPDNGEINELSMEKNDRNFMLRNDIDKILQDAVVHRKFRMYYQPIYSLKDKKFISCEALIRLNDEKYGFISPEFMIRNAERNGLIVNIGDIVLDEVSAFLKRYKSLGLNLDFVEINLSVAQI
ncbi:MAG: EAL domain-containing protein, partial [Erysipelotrichaceae bacterium]